MDNSENLVREAKMVIVKKIAHDTTEELMEELEKKPTSEDTSFLKSLDPKLFEGDHWAADLGMEE